MMRIVDTISSIPMMLYVILIMVVLGSGLHSIILAMGLTYWVGMVRIVRSQVLTMREQEFVSAAVLLGVPTRKILVRHLIPNAMGPIMVALTMQIPQCHVHRGVSELHRTGRLQAPGILGRAGQRRAAQPLHQPLSALLPRPHHEYHHPGAQPVQRRTAGLSGPRLRK